MRCASSNPDGAVAVAYAAATHTVIVSDNEFFGDLYVS